MSRKRKIIIITSPPPTAGAIQEVEDMCDGTLDASEVKVAVDYDDTWTDGDKLADEALEVAANQFTT